MYQLQFDSQKRIDLQIRRERCLRKSSVNTRITRILSQIKGRPLRRSMRESSVSLSHRLKTSSVTHLSVRSFPDPSVRFPRNAQQSRNPFIQISD